ncbi:MAG TPA: hypothetical protein VK609_07310 [Mucilaginibacter sp.]|nr:hypothetical protein [Mucilaginibacter sp.]
MDRPFQINITNVYEIHMGSPYNDCEIELVGFNKAKLPRVGWQDKYAWSSDSTNLVLIKWNNEKNKPSFNLILIDTITGEIKESAKIMGLINKISLNKYKVKFNKFLYDKERSSSGNLCCTIDEEYNFS